MSKINSDYREKMKEIMKNPEYVSSPRGLKIAEVLNDSFSCDMDCPIITLESRNLNYSFMTGEAAWMLDGRNDVKTISSFMKGIVRFSDDGIYFFGAYGPKIVSQLQYVLRTLKADQDSRQAVINIWRESPGSSKDIPCTLSLQFLLRKSSDKLWLHTIATMRSNDVWLGLPYDSFNFSAISFYLACLLRSNGVSCNLGKLTINAGSRHVYESDFEKVEKALVTEDSFPLDFSFNNLINQYYERPDQFTEGLYEAAGSKFTLPENKFEIIQ